MSSPTAQYRLLVSRAVTQRLTSPSLDDIPPPPTTTLATWERTERLNARAKIIACLAVLGVPWMTFTHDVEKARQEVHILAPTRYEEEKVVPGHDAKVKERDGMRDYAGGEMVKREAWKRMQDGHVDLLRRFGRARLMRINRVKLL
ncbi:hypothetical protein P153DRAFT_400017 [Dothidotthia symphoricarpi CBS 119687]|uniref:Uncharacterized protein n=1 Tax=Dothidotthia symphoricarpi CBS 119687 TaxID=1392245 RepID=A0A6A6A2W1_9PLEO|nr:uncharacterized protein P153DRAFT_400017 [Dothidotthia symphoricarpi CBS 119687]KAF2125886.1 hypothetical protein P153DRAFT_400017 [Dothidotthia symphoricarpi CBS 119687]